MAAAAEPTGQWIACDVVSGEQADDPLYTPLIQQVHEIIGWRSLLYTGDCKMVVSATRAEMVQQGGLLCDESAHDRCRRPAI
jgi:transposase